MDAIIDLDLIKHSPIYNYIVPGLTSWMIKDFGPGRGCIRLFESSRCHSGVITPHSHRYDFQCRVLAGEVTNTVWIKSAWANKAAECMTKSALYFNELGHYDTENLGQQYWYPIEFNYKTGQNYSMQYNDVHSIVFGNGAKVLFFEGEQKADVSVILEPYCKRQHATIPTLKTEDWMFLKGEANGPQTNDNNIGTNNTDSLNRIS